MAKRKTISVPSLFEPVASPEKKEHAKPAIQEESEIITVSVLNITVEQIQPEKSQGKSVTLRDGTVLFFGDEVYCDCAGRDYENKVFVITEMNDWDNCESKVLIVATNKDNLEEKATNLTPGLKGLDANWFRKVNV